MQHLQGNVGTSLFSCSNAEDFSPCGVGCCLLQGDRWLLIIGDRFLLIVHSVRGHVARTRVVQNQSILGLLLLLSGFTGVD